MRFAVALIAVLVVGCYKPSAEDACRVLCPAGECPSGATCMAGRCVPNGGTCPPVDPDAPIDVDAFVAGDAFVSPDAVQDAGGTMTCAPAITNLEGIYRSGQSFTMNRLRTRAAMLTLDTTSGTYAVSVGDSPNVDSSPPIFKEEIVRSGLITELGYPRLTPDGNTIFMTGKDAGGNAFPLVSSFNSLDGKWSPPAPLQLQDQNGLPMTAAFGLVLGTPSEASPRRMPISFDTANLLEYEEVAQNTWRQRLSTTAAALSVSLIREPSFTPDGLRVVFVGQKASGPVAIFSSTRFAIGSTWTVATQVFDDGVSSEGSPHLAADCSVLFYDNSNTSVVNRAR